MKTVQRLILSGMQTLLNGVWQAHQAIVINNGVIEAIIPDAMVKHHLPAKEYHFPKNFYLSPGFIDIHIHGTHGYDVMDDDPAALYHMSLELAKEGITGFLATTMTSSKEKLKSVLNTIATTASTLTDGAEILGIHLEGPFISPEKFGAQAKKDIQGISLSLFQDFQKQAQGLIKLVTMAPELPNAINFIKALNEIDVITSIGHSNATYDDTILAIQSGSRSATHLFNAMSGINHREPGAVTALLLSNGVMTELIVDGKHLHPAIVQLSLEVKGKDKIILVTDAMRAKCLRNGSYDLGGQTVNVIDGSVTLPDGTLAGSVLHMFDAVKNMQKFTACSLEDAIAMCTYNPLYLLGFTNHKGRIDIGKDADLVVLDNEQHVVMTIRQGRIIFAR